jgi:3-hydroxy-9,10-secoandrosta-1,3,5(10)-triene-9,17-dione monooxygenase
MAPLASVEIGDSSLKKSGASHLLSAVQALLPSIRARSESMGAAGRLDDDLVEELERAGLFSIFVPRAFGGAGAGPQVANELTELLATADCSTAWVSSFYMLHNLLLCRYPLKAQQELFDRGPSVRAAAVWAPMGKAEPAPGGSRVTGKWGYATGIHHASCALVPALLEGEACWFIVPRERLTVLSDWNTVSMSATGSSTVIADGVFVPEHMGSPIKSITSASQHGGVSHPEAAYRYPFAAMRMVTPSLIVGALGRAVELFAAKLRTSKPYGIARIDRSPSRIRWAEAYETHRIARILRDYAQGELIERYDSGLPQTLEAEGDLGLHSMAIIRQATAAVRSLVDGSGSSVYQRADELQRICLDISMLSTHVLFADYDVVMDRHARWVLGMGLAPEDPKIRLS